MKKPVSSVRINRFISDSSESTLDLLATEEPLEIRLKYFDGIDFKEKRLAVTMRTPGHDFELAIGFLITEGIIESHQFVDKIFYCEDVKDEAERGNVLIVHLKEEVGILESVFNRNFYVNSSCGVCGKSSIESIESLCELKILEQGFSIDTDLIHSIPDLANKDQSVFKHTGGLHASALFDQKGALLLIREDIGRHNALDKLIGGQAIQDAKNADKILFVSGRAGFELVQKAVVAGFPIMIAVGAPSSLAVELANQYGLTLIGFARNNKFNVYSGNQRIKENNVA